MAISFDFTESIGPEFYYRVQLTPPGLGASPWDIAANWTSSLPIDTYVMDSDQFSNYQSTGSTAAIFTDEGASGRIFIQLSPADSSRAPFYIVLDNTAAGSRSASGTATIHVFGETRITGSSSSAAATGFFIGLAVAIVAGLAVVAVVALLLMGKRKKELKAPPPAIPPPTTAGSAGAPPIRLGYYPAVMPPPSAPPPSPARPGVPPGSPPHGPPPAR